MFTKPLLSVRPRLGIESIAMTNELRGNSVIMWKVQRGMHEDEESRPDGPDTRLLAPSIISDSLSALFGWQVPKAWEPVSSNPLPIGFWFTFCSERLPCKILKKAISIVTGRTEGLGRSDAVSYTHLRAHETS